MDVLRATHESALVSSQTAALVSALIVGVIGIGNLLYSFLNGKWDRRDRGSESKADREQALDLARAEREHQLELVTREGEHRLRVLREERLFDQRRDAYLDSMKALTEMQEWIASTYPILSFAGQEQRPKWSSSPDGSHLGSRVALYGSPEVLEAIETYRRGTIEFAGIASEIDAYIAQRAPHQETDARMRLQALRENLAAQFRNIAALKRDELRQPPPAG